MSTELKFKLTTASVILGFAIQLIASVWFLSGLSASVGIHSRMIDSLKLEQDRISPVVYRLDSFADKIKGMEKDVDEIKKDVKTLLRNAH